MPLTGTVRNAAAGVLGLDFNADGQKMTPKRAKAFRDAGYKFCVRYVPREASAKTVAFDLRRDEAQMLLDEGFALMAVQHFKSDAGWTPTPQLGTDYGAFAARWAREKVELPEGVCLFLDLEAVASGTPKNDVVAYCTNWHAQVAAAGYAPGIYLGDRARLSSKEVAQLLPFEHHWIAFNETFDIPGRGFQLKQKPVGAGSPLRPPGVGGFLFQADHTRTDDAGGTLSWLAP